MSLLFNFVACFTFSLIHGFWLQFAFCALLLRITNKWLHLERSVRGGTVSPSANATEISCRRAVEPCMTRPLLAHTEALQVFLFNVTQSDAP